MFAKAVTQFAARFFYVEFVAESTSDAINNIGGCAVQNMCFRINERTPVTAFTRAIDSYRF